MLAAGVQEWASNSVYCRCKLRAFISKCLRLWPKAIAKSPNVFVSKHVKVCACQDLTRDRFIRKLSAGNVICPERSGLADILGPKGKWYPGSTGPMRAESSMSIS